MANTPGPKSGEQESIDDELDLTLAGFLAMSGEQEAEQVRGRTIPGVGADPSLADIEKDAIAALSLLADERETLDALGDDDNEPTEISAVPPEDPAKTALLAELTALEGEVTEHIDKVKLLIIGVPDAERDYNAGRVPLAAETQSLLTRAFTIRSKAISLHVSNIDWDRACAVYKKLRNDSPAAAPEGPTEQERREIALEGQITVLEERLVGLIESIEAINDDASLWRQLLADINAVTPAVNTLWEDINNLLPLVQPETPTLFTSIKECSTNIGTIKMKLADLKASVVGEQIGSIRADAKKIAREWHVLKIETERLLNLDGRTSAALEEQSQKVLAAVNATEDGKTSPIDLLRDINLLLSSLPEVTSIATLLQGSDIYLNTVIEESQSLAERVTAEITRLSAAESAATAAATSGEASAEYRPGQELTIENVDANTSTLTQYWDLVRAETRILLENPDRNLATLEAQKGKLTNLKEHFLANLVGDIDRLTAKTDASHPRIGVLYLAKSTLAEISAKIDGLIEKLDAEAEIERLIAAASPAVPVEPEEPLATAAADPLPLPFEPAPIPNDAAPAVDPTPAEEAQSEPTPVPTEEDGNSGAAWDTFMANGERFENQPGEDANSMHDDEISQFHDKEASDRHNRRRNVRMALGGTALTVLALAIMVGDKKISPGLVDSRDFAKPQGNSDTVKEPAPAQKPAAEELPDAITVKCIMELDNVLACHLAADGLTPEAIAKFGFEPNIKWLGQNKGNLALGHLNIIGKGAEYRGLRTVVGVQRGVRGALVNVQAPDHPIILTRRGR